MRFAFSMNRNASFDPSGDQLGADIYPVTFVICFAFPFAVSSTHTCDTCECGLFAIYASRLPSGDHAASLASRSPDGLIAFAFGSATATILNAPFTMYATRVPSGE